MTAIAYRYPYIAGDYRAVDSIGYISTWDTKILVANDKPGLYVGYSGTAGWEEDILNYIWLELTKQAKPEELQKLKDRSSEDKVDFNALAVYKNPHGIVKAYELYSNGRYMEIKAPFCAVGSGTKIAIGAMGFGADAFQAIDVATLDPYIGYPIDGYNVNTGEYFCYEDADSLKMRGTEKVKSLELYNEVSPARSVSESFKTIVMPGSDKPFSFKNL